MSYEIEFLSNEDFEQLPYLDMDRSLGVADPKIEKAYVRKTGAKVLDVYNAIHELEHLEEGQSGKHADHYRNGVYYKDFGNLFGGGGGATKGLAAQAAANPALRAPSGFSGFTSPTGPNLAALGAGSSQFRAPSSVTGFGGPSFNVPRPATAGFSIPQAPGTPQQPPSSGSNRPNIVSTAKNFLFGTGSPATAPGGTGAAIPQQVDKTSNVLDQFKQEGLLGGGRGNQLFGLGTALLGGKFAPKPQAPDVGGLSSVGALRDFQFQRSTELDPIREEQLNQDFDEADEREMKQLRNTFKNLRPGTDLETDSVFRRETQALQDRQAERRIQGINQERREDIQTQLQISNSEFQQLVLLAQADIFDIQTQLGIDVQEAENFKDIFSKFGQIIAQPQEEV